MSHPYLPRFSLANRFSRNVVKDNNCKRPGNSRPYPANGADRILFLWVRTVGIVSTFGNIGLTRWPKSSMSPKHCSLAKTTPVERKASCHSKISIFLTGIDRVVPIHLRPISDQMAGFHTNTSSIVFQCRATLEINIGNLPYFAWID